MAPRVRWLSQLYTGKASRLGSDLTPVLHLACSTSRASPVAFSQSPLMFPTHWELCPVHYGIVACLWFTESRVPKGLVPTLIGCAHQPQSQTATLSFSVRKPGQGVCGLFYLSS